MGKKTYQKADVSRPMTKKLDIADLLVLKESTDSHYYAIHKRYFSGEKLACPACGSTKTRCSKVIQRTFKDILWNKSSANDSQQQDFQIIELSFYQRYLRCDNCHNSVFPEPIDFANKGCRFTNRLSDALADGTFRYSYKKVCDYYGVPASTASIGPIMRRRIQYRESLQLPISTPKELIIMEAIFYREVHPVVLALREEGVYCIDVLKDSSEDTVLTFLCTLDASKVNTVYIDPVDSIRNAAMLAFPTATLAVTNECIQRYARDAMLDIIHKDGKRFPVRRKDSVLTMPNKHNDCFTKQQIEDGMRSRLRLKAAYERHQALMELMSGKWTYDALGKWVHGLPENLPEFNTLVDVIDIFWHEISDYVDLTEKEKPPDQYPTAMRAVCEAFREMPHCIFDVLRARCLFTIPPDTIEENGIKYRLGINTSRLTKNMNNISYNITEDREYELERKNQIGWYQYSRESKSYLERC